VNISQPKLRSEKFAVNNNNNNNNNNNETDELTNSMQHRPSCETNSSSASQEILRIYGTGKFITVFTAARHLYSS
jgi:hypothetical protein